MVAVPRRFFILALAIATLAFSLVVAPVRASLDEELWETSQGNLGSAHYEQGGSYQRIRAFVPGSIHLPEFNNEALALANKYGARFVEKNGKTVYFQSMIPRGSALERKLIQTHPAVKGGTVVLFWKHTGGDQFHLVGADLIKASNFNWNSYLEALGNVLRV